MYGEVIKTIRLYLYSWLYIFCSTEQNGVHTRLEMEEKANLLPEGILKAFRLSPDDITRSESHKDNRNLDV